MKTTLVLLFTAAALIVTLALVAGDGRSETKNLEQATFAGGCFWCIEAPFDKLEGVVSAVSGYTGGMIVKPTYGQVSGGKTRHIEAVLVTYDPGVVTYAQLLDVFWRQFDPTDAGGSFYDRGHQYTSAIFYHDEEQKKFAEASKQALAESGRFDAPIVTPIRPAQTFYPAEDYHQDYYRKKPDHYNRYRKGLGPRSLHRADLGAGQTRENFQRKLGQTPRSRASPEAHAPPMERDTGRRHRAAVPQRVLG